MKLFSTQSKHGTIRSRRTRPEVRLLACGSRNRAFVVLYWKAQRMSAVTLKCTCGKMRTKVGKWLVCSNCDSVQAIQQQEGQGSRITTKFDSRYEENMDYKEWKEGWYPSVNGD